MVETKRLVRKVPAVTLTFWVIKILATTLGETGGDAVSMSWLGETTPEAGSGGVNGYLVGTAIFGMLLVVQFGLGGVGVMTLPRLVPVFGVKALFFALILFSVVTLLMLPFLADYPVREPDTESGAGLLSCPAKSQPWMSST